MSKSAAQLLWPVAMLACLLQAGTGAVAAEIKPGAIKLEKEGGAPKAVPGDVDTDIKENARSKNELVIAPLPSRDPLLGWVLSVPAMYLWNPEGGDPENEPWITGLVGFYSENESWGGGVFHSMSVGGDRWRFKTALFKTDINYKYYGIGSNGDGAAIPLNQPVDMFVVEGLRRTVSDWFVGLKYIYSESSAAIDANINCADTAAPSLCTAATDLFPFEFTLSAIAPRVQYDTRDNQFYPREGVLFDGTASIGSEKLGGDADFQKYIFTLNYYRSLNPKGVLATRVNLEYASEDSPFFIYPAYGGGGDLRGYQTGTYRNQFLIAAQAEYRHLFTKRWGGVIFAGVGSVDEELFGWDETLPSIGLGGRYVIAPKNDMTLRLDMAWGKSDKQFYFGIGESF